MTILTPRKPLTRNEQLAINLWSAEGLTEKEVAARLGYTTASGCD
jgi:DNA-binding CsgD family transcriptional regulator